jgi:hypothetical protein
LFCRLRGWFLAVRFVAALVVAGEPGHQRLRVLVVDVDEEPGRSGTAENPGRAALVQQFDVAILADAVVESWG